MHRTFFIKTIPLFTFILLFSFSNQAQNLTSQVDEYLLSHSQPNAPGAAVLIAKDGKTIYKKAVGMANLELNVTLSTDHVFEIGSITKQFTAVSILMLEEQGKLKVEDDITKYIPDYPTHGKTITIHHLLNHTSGIKSYTSMESFIKNARTDMTPTELIDVFKNEPMDFNPGEKFLYNNSGYILLGHIIEVVSRQSYAEFIQDNIFSKLGMKSSYYGSMTKIIPNRASGYQDKNGFVNADYLSLTLPYAAGSIMSTVDDLLIWQNAISANKLIKRSSLEKAIKGSTLNNGEKIPYGYGWSQGSVNGSDTYEHSGGIFGYVTNGIFFPNENIYVIILSNCDCSNVVGISTKIAAMAIGKPFPSTKDAITLSNDKLKKWVGAYQFPDGAIRYITVKDGKIFSQREGSTKLEIYPMSESKFIFEEGDITYNFSKENGKKQAEFVTNVSTIGHEIDKAPPAKQKEISLAPDVLKQYIGKYELQPGFIIEITISGNQIFAQATGQPQFEIFAKSIDNFFLKVVPAKLVFSKGGNGKVNMVTLHQGGQQMLGKKID